PRDIRELASFPTRRSSDLQPFADIRGELAQMLLRRLDGVLRLKDSRLLMFQAQRDEIPGLLELLPDAERPTMLQVDGADTLALQDRKSTRLNSSHVKISYA